MLNFVLHMIQHPEVQVKAQEELDRVIGRSRLPDFEDREELPYLGAIYKETLRLHPVTPLGIPHSTSADDIYKGMHIPKGSILFPNIWYVSYHSYLVSSYPL
jgi:cytochrome P450